MKQVECKTVWFTHSLISFTISILRSENDINCIQSVRFGTDNQKPGLECVDEYTQIIGLRLCRYLDGCTDDFLDISLDFSGLTNFQIQVLETARKIPRGSCVTYSELANRSGYPEAIRAVASVMRANRFPLIIPCHRVVRKDGNCGGYCGQQSGRMVDLKQHLLKLEC